MEYNSLLEWARELPFLKGLSAEFIEKIVAMASEVRFAADEIIFRAGEKSDFFYLLRSGKVALEVCTSGHTLVVQTLGEGDELGWSSYLAEETRCFQARALVRVQALRFDGARLRKACEADPSLGFALEHRLLWTCTRPRNRAKERRTRRESPGDGADLHDRVATVRRVSSLSDRGLLWPPLPCWRGW
jgi:CRP-like cAMP-binding protein